MTSATQGSGYMSDSWSRAQGFKYYKQLKIMDYMNDSMIRAHLVYQLIHVQLVLLD